MIIKSVAGLLVRTRPGAGKSLASQSGRRLDAAGVQFELEPLFTVNSGTADSGLAAAPASEWHIARPKGKLAGAHPWELANQALQTLTTRLGGEDIFVEPDFVQSWPCGVQSPEQDHQPCRFEDQNPDLPHVAGTFAWHLGDAYSQLKEARLGSGERGTAVRIAHLDTGYDPDHVTLPEHLRTDLQRNFVQGESLDNASDPQRRAAGCPGHGTATLAILAGKKYDASKQNYHFNDFLGGAPHAEIVPVRIGNSVVQFLTSDVARGIDYAAQLCADEGTRIHVLSMSLGGLASAAWADTVNHAYATGIVLITAAGNNFADTLGGFPTHYIVHPARFKRVIAVCGAMADRTPYYGLKFRDLQGNWGPASKMATAVAAFTPNIPWAEIGCAELVSMRGMGTSSATPQVAAAAALYLQKHAAVIFDCNRYPEPWMRVEAVRNALFAGADYSAESGIADHLGNGILQALRSLRIEPRAAQALTSTPADSAGFAFLGVLAGRGIAPSSPELQMLALEATQLAQIPDDHNTQIRLLTAVPDPDLPAEAIPAHNVRRFLEAVGDHKQVSGPLKKRAQEALQALGGRVIMPDNWRPTGYLPPGFTPPEPPCRMLRAFSVDPSLATKFETAPISEVLIRLRWEELKPGPVGEYVEVIDVDPATGYFYEPVNLDDPRLLAQNGVAPSQGSPQFHQQMAYAVTNLTIQHFEAALGRRALWRPHWSPQATSQKDDSRFVPRLRVYPHALRDSNAFYSPEKIALLFGYFNAKPVSGADELPGGTVFACLSQDIIAHETTHALLDGMHRRFLNATNPDVLAFHEAFADIVALFQHFTFPEIVEHQIATTRGEIQSHETLLAQLAGQFGYARGGRQALRDAIGEKKGDTWVRVPPDPTKYETAKEEHERGSILVAAVFDAFLAIYARRTADLLRLATGGSGVLYPGSLHPDLVRRLSTEAAKTARHVLTMCIRALDYCPPVDITFGEFLRAIITADYDLVADDRLQYRVAFIEAFRRRGIYPRDVRSLGVDSLLWRGPDDETGLRHPSRPLLDSLQAFRETSLEYLYAKGEKHRTEREALFALERRTRRELHDWLLEHFRRSPEDADFLGLDLDVKSRRNADRLSFEVHTARFALRTKPDGGVDPQILITVLQDKTVPIDPTNPAGGNMSYEGGATIVADLSRLAIRYCIRKRMGSGSRLVRQQAYRIGLLESERSTYLPPESNGFGKEPFALLHRAI